MYIKQHCFVSKETRAYHSLLMISTLVSRSFAVNGDLYLAYLTICLEIDGSPLGNYAVDEKCK